MVDNALEQVVSFIKAGNTEQGGKILVSLLKENQRLERAWAWLYACVKTDDQRIYCLKKVIELNPQHDRAKAALEKLMGQQNSQKDATSIATEEIKTQQAPKDNQPQEPTAKVKGRSPLPKKSTNADRERIANKNKIKVEFVKPTIIFNKPDDLPYSFERPTPADLPDIESAMFGTRLMIGGISITAHDYPRCIEAGRTLHKSQCHICEFFAESDCPIRRDPTLVRETQTLFAQNKRYLQEYQDRRDAVLDAIYHELKAHGRPLHYEVLAKIMRDRHPELRLNAKKLVHYMGWHPEKFEWVEKGVYKAKY